MSNQDEYLKDNVEAQLNWDERFNKSQIKVDIEDNKVILTGIVSSYAAKNAAEAKTRTIEGVSEIQNNLIVEENSDLQNLSDKDKIRYATVVLSHNIDSTQRSIDISIESNKVNISGEVSAYWKKEEAESILFKIPGINEVENNLNVVPTLDILDGEIKKGIIESVDRDYLVNNKDLDINVKNGKVILSGKVPNPVSYFELLKIVKYSPGVIEIEDNLVIERPIT